MQEIKTAEQKRFEEMVQVAIKLLAALKEAERTEIFNYIIYKYNERNERS